MRERDICPKFCKYADLKCPAQYSAERGLPLSNGHYGAGINNFFDEYFHFMKLFGQSWPVLGWPSVPPRPITAKLLIVEKLIRGLSFSGLPFPFHEL